MFLNDSWRERRPWLLRGWLIVCAILCGSMVAVGLLWPSLATIVALLVAPGPLLAALALSDPDFLRAELVRLYLNAVASVCLLIVIWMGANILLAMVRG